MGEDTNYNILLALKASGADFSSGGVQMNQDALMRMCGEPNDIYSDKAEAYYYGLGASVINGGPVQDPLFNFHSNLSNINYQGPNYNNGLVINTFNTGTRMPTPSGGYLNTFNTGTNIPQSGNFLSSFQTGSVVASTSSQTTTNSTDKSGKSGKSGKTSKSKGTQNNNTSSTSSATKNTSTTNSTSTTNTAQNNGFQGHNKAGTLYYFIKYDGPNGRPTVSFTDKNGKHITSVEARKRDANLYNEAQTQRKEATKAFDKA